MAKIKKILVIIVFVFSFSILANAQLIPTSYLFLEVVDSNQQPVANAKVESQFSENYSNEKSSKKTNEKGIVDFRIIGFRDAPNDFIISKSGYYDFDVLAMFRISDIERNYSQRDNFKVELLKIPQNNAEKKALGNEQIKREFFLAVMKGDTPKVRKLLKSGIDPNISTNDLRGVPSPKDIPAILYAADNADIETINEFLSAGINLRKENSNIRKLLSYFIGSANPLRTNEYLTPEQSKEKLNAYYEHVDKLIKAGADLKSTNLNGETLLTIAAKRGFIEIVKKLLDSGFPINTKNKSGSTTLLEMSNLGYSENVDENKTSIINLLLKSGANPNITNDADYDCNSPLITAARQNQANFIKLLLSYKADVNLKCKSGETALNSIEWKYNPKYPELIDVFLDAGANVNVSGVSGETPLMTAIESGNMSVIKKLLDKGASINAQDGLDRTPLVHSILGVSQKPDIAIVELLLKKGADPNVLVKKKGEESYCTALSGAVWHEPLECFFRGDSEVCWNRDNVQYASSEIIELLLANNSDINPNCKDKDTPLVSAAKGGRIDILKLLIERGADTKGEQGTKALQEAKQRLNWDKQNKNNLEEVIKILEAEGVK